MRFRSTATRQALGLALVAVSISLALLTCPSEAAVRLASSSPAGENANSWCEQPALSADGRFVAFWSEATNLVAVDTGLVSHVFLKDLVTGQTYLVSSSPDGVAGNAWSSEPSVSGDGRLVVFYSYASNLAPDDTELTNDVFVKDTQTGQVQLVTGSGIGEMGSADPRWTGFGTNGRVVAYQSAAGDLVPGGPVGVVQVYAKDLESGQTHLVSCTASGEPGNGPSGSPSVSANGRYIAFHSSATNLVAGAAGGVFVKDLETGQIELASSSATGEPGVGVSRWASLSADGRTVAFQSSASNLVPGDTNELDDIFVKDLTTGQIRMAYSPQGGLPSDGESAMPSLSANGRYVAFRSRATNLVEEATDGKRHIFVTDTLEGKTKVVTVSDTGQLANGDSERASLSADGRLVAFQSLASNLSEGDTDGTWDIFVADTGFPECMKGDLNGDQHISLADAILCLRMYVLQAPPANECAAEAADVNCDGRITLADGILLIRAYVLGAALPCQ